MTRTLHHPWLNKFAWLTAVMTFLLLGLGGLVTSHEAGLAVPDWPTSYGYNMFLFPVHFWRANILYEHTHRLLASFVGLLTTILAVWLWLREPRRWLRWLGVTASLAVVLQGVLGGLRVTMLKDQIGIFHAALAQSFFVMVTLIALVLAGTEGKLAASVPSVGASWFLRRLTVGSTIWIFIQLILGASMRHQHAGLAVPDFPLAYGKVWPATDAAFLEKINSGWSRVDQPSITAFQITLHMTHRLVALSIGILVGCVAWRAQREHGARSLTAKLALAWCGMISIQAILGAATVWSNKAADVATAHVLVGALVLLTGTFLSVAMLSHARSRRVLTKKLDHRMTAPWSVIDFPEVRAMPGALSGGGEASG
jgi:cytochrome c oxidase assembly protein subunit 15